MCRPIMEFLGPLNARVLASTTKELQAKADKNLPYVSDFHLLLLQVTMIMSNEVEIVASTCMDEHRIDPCDRDDLDKALGLQITPLIHKLKGISIQARRSGIGISTMTTGILSLLPRKFRDGTSLNEASTALKEVIGELLSRGWYPKSLYQNIFDATDIMAAFVDIITDPFALRASFNMSSFRWIAKEMIIAYGQTVMCAMMALCMSVRADGQYSLSDRHISGIFNRGVEDLGWANEHQTPLCKSNKCECRAMRDDRTQRLAKSRITDSTNRSYTTSST